MLLEAKVVIDDWRAEYNTVSPHSALGYQPPARYAAHCTHQHQQQEPELARAGGLG
ncbi:MAG: putative transposase [Pseudonocardia sp.]